MDMNFYQVHFSQVHAEYHEDKKFNSLQNSKFNSS